jgi:hypothetical protein
MRPPRRRLPQWEELLDCLDQVEAELQRLLLVRRPVRERRELVQALIRDRMLPLLQRAGRRNSGAD